MSETLILDASDVKMAQLRRASEPSNDIRGNATGWLLFRSGEEVALIHPQKNEIRRFDYTRSSGTDRQRAIARASSYAQDNPVSLDTPKGELISQPMFATTPGESGVSVSDIQKEAAHLRKRPGFIFDRQREVIAGKAVKLGLIDEAEEKRLAASKWVATASRAIDYERLAELNIKIQGSTTDALNDRSQVAIERLVSAAGAALANIDAPELNSSSSVEPKQSEVVKPQTPASAPVAEQKAPGKPANAGVSVSVAAPFERGQHNYAGELSKADGEAGFGTYAYPSDNTAMRQYYTKNGETRVFISPKVGAKIMDLTTPEAKRAIVAAAKEISPNGKTTATQAAVQRHPWAIRSYMSKSGADAFLIEHCGPGLPTGKQLVILNEGAFDHGTTPASAPVAEKKAPGKPANAGVSPSQADDQQAIEVAGRKVYPISVRSVDGQITARWVVQSADNVRRAAKGEREGIGNTVHATKEVAIKEAERESALDVAKARRSADAEDERAERAATKEANKGKSITERSNDARLDQLNRLPPSAGLGTGSRREAMQKAIEQDRLVTTKMVYDPLAKKRDNEAVSRGFSLPLANIDYPGVKECLEARARLKADQYEKPEYRVYRDGSDSGPFNDITKTEHDYAQSLIAERNAKNEEEYSEAPAP